MALIFENDESLDLSAPQADGSVSVPQSPNPADVIGGDWTDNIDKATKFVSTLGKSVSDFYTARDTAQRSVQDRAFNRFTRSAELDLARAQVTGATELGKLSLAAQLAKARAAVTGAAGGTSALLLLIVAGAAWYFAKHK